MPTVICLDVSLSMSRRSGDRTLLDYTTSSLRSFLSNVASLCPHEPLSLITFSGEASLCCSFTKDVSEVKAALAKVTPGDRTDMRAMLRAAHTEATKWSLICPSHIVLITDRVPALCEKEEGVPGLEAFPAGCTLSLVALTPSEEAAKGAAEFWTSIGLTGRFYPGPVLRQESIDRILETVMLDNYSRFETKLCLGHQSTSVSLSPTPDFVFLGRLAGQPAPATFPSTLRVHGFLPATDLHSPPYLSRHLVHCAGFKSPTKVTAKTPDLRVLLNDALRAQDSVAVVELGMGWFGTIASFLPKTERNSKKSNLVFSTIPPGSIPWLGNLNLLALKRLVSADKQHNLPYRQAFANSYDSKSDGGAMVWGKASTLKQSVLKVVRYAKRLPDKGSTMFLKELNKVRRSIMFYGFTEMMGVLCELLEREKTAANGDIIEKCLAQLRSENDPTKQIKG